MSLVSFLNVGSVCWWKESSSWLLFLLRQFWI
jgi:hypothetical protein